MRRVSAARQPPSSTPIADQFSSRLSSTLGRVATDVALLLSEEDAWVHRRVEQIEFVGLARVRRAMSIDFTVPDLASLRQGEDEKRQDPATLLVPLALPKKRTLAGVDVRDETGRSLPIVTRSRNSQVAYELIVRLSLQVVRSAGQRDL